MRGAGPRVAAVVLAAGRSRRMGGANKLLEPIDGAPMIACVVDTLAASPVDAIVVVTGHDADRVETALAGRPVHCVRNPAPEAGMSRSLRVGVGALDDAVDAALVCLGDMPRVRPSHVAALVGAFAPEAGRAVCVPTHAGRRGHPVLWAARFFPEMEQLEGDVGARELLARHAALVASVPVPDAGVLLDVDTPEALAALAARPDGG